MPDFKRLIVEIHRRSLWQVVAIYIGGAWACYEIIDTVTDRLALPVWLPVLAIIFFLLGLPFVLATAFVREEAPGERVPGEPAAAAAAEAASPEAVDTEALAARQERIARRRLLTWRNLGVAFVAVLAAWGAVAAGWLLLGGRGDSGEGETAGIEVSALRVAVLPFSVRGSEEVTYLGEPLKNLAESDVNIVYDCERWRPGMGGIMSTADYFIPSSEFLTAAELQLEDFSFNQKIIKLNRWSLMMLIFLKT